MGRAFFATTADKLAGLLVGAGLIVLAANNPSEADFRQELTSHVRGNLADSAEDQGPVAQLAVGLFSGGLLRSVIDEIPVRRTNFLLFSKFDVDLNAVPLLRDPRTRNPCFFGVMGRIFACPGNGERLPVRKQGTEPESASPVVRTDSAPIDSQTTAQPAQPAAGNCAWSWTYFPPRIEDGIAFFITVEASGRFHMESSDFSGGEGTYTSQGASFQLVDDQDGSLATIDRCAPDAVLTFNDGRRFRLETGSGGLEAEAARRGVSIAEPVG